MSKVIHLKKKVPRVLIAFPRHRATRKPLTVNEKGIITPSAPVEPIPMVQKEEPRFQQTIDPELLEKEYSDGFEAGKKASEEEYKSQMELLLAAERAKNNSFFDSLKEHMDMIARETEELSLKLAIGIAEQIIRREVHFGKEFVVGQIKEAIRRVVGVEKIIIRVHPSDEEILKEQRNDLQSHSESLREIIIEPDSSIEPGGCIIESQSGNVDARLSTQLKRIEEILFDQTLHH